MSEEPQISKETESIVHRAVGGEQVPDQGPLTYPINPFTNPHTIALGWRIAVEAAKNAGLSVMSGRGVPDLVTNAARPALDVLSERHRDVPAYVIDAFGTQVVVVHGAKALQKIMQQPQDVNKNPQVARITPGLAGGYHRDTNPPEFIVTVRSGEDYTKYHEDLGEKIRDVGKRESQKTKEYLAQLLEGKDEVMIDVEFLRRIVLYGVITEIVPHYNPNQLAEDLQILDEGISKLTSVLLTGLVKTEEQVTQELLKPDQQAIMKVFDGLYQNIKKHYKEGDGGIYEQLLQQPYFAQNENALRATVNLLLEASIGSTAFSAANVLKQCFEHPQIWEKMQAEITSNDRNARAYRRDVIYAGIFNHPPVEFTMRTAEVDMMIGDLLVKKGTTILLDVKHALAHLGNLFFQKDNPNIEFMEQLRKQGLDGAPFLRFWPKPEGFDRSCPGEGPAVKIIGGVLETLLKLGYTIESGKTLGKVLSATAGPNIFLKFKRTKKRASHTEDF